MYVGDLGQHCELLFAAWASKSGASGISFKVSDKRDATLDNLQDAFEVPYWELIAELFDDVRSETSNSNSLGPETMLLVLHNLTTNVEDEISRLGITDGANLPQPILDGISKRINTLRGILDFLGFESYGKDEASSTINVTPLSDMGRPNNENASAPHDGEISACVSDFLQIVLELHQLILIEECCLDISKLPFPGHCYSARIQSILYINEWRSAKKRKYQ